MNKLVVAISLLLGGCTTNPGAAPDAAPAAPAPVGVPLGFTYGRTTGADEVLAGSNTLVGIPIDIPTDGVLIGLGVIATQTDGEQLYFALYTDAGGRPGALIQGSPLTTLATGTNEAAVPHTRVTAGPHWIIEVSTGTTHFASTGDPAAMLVAQTPFGPLPARIDAASPPALVTGKAPDAFVRLLHWTDETL